MCLIPSINKLLIIESDHNEYSENEKEKRKAENALPDAVNISDLRY